MNTRSYIICLLLIWLAASGSFGQGRQAKRVLAYRLVTDYKEMSKFKQDVNTNTLDQWQKLFDPEARIVFDIPFREEMVINDNIRRISKDDRPPSGTINVYGKTLPLALFREILQREADKFDLDSIHCRMTLSPGPDESRIDQDTIVYEIEKSFDSTRWSVRTSEKYLICVVTKGNSARIVSIKVNPDSHPQTNVLLKFMNVSSFSRKNSRKELEGIKATLSVTFNDPINDSTYTVISDRDGLARFNAVAAYTSKIHLDTVESLNNIRYRVPLDWIEGQKKVNEQPPDGYIVELTPYAWNGWAYSVFLSGGLYIPGKVRTDNFQPGSDFKNSMGYKAGPGFEFTRFLNYRDWKTDTSKILKGFGSGLTVEWGGNKTSSQHFDQVRYHYIDPLSDNCEVMFSGQAYKETNRMVYLGVPLFAEFKKWQSSRLSLSLRVGAKLSFPVSMNYKASGSFSRWGYYEDLNTLPVKDDRLYNYFSDSLISYSGDISSRSLMAEGFVKLNAFFNIFKNSPDNSLEVGLLFSVPFTNTRAVDYAEGRAQTYQGYWMNTENDEYHSIAYSRNKLYSFYFGITVGMNIITYKPR